MHLFKNGLENTLFPFFVGTLIGSLIVSILYISFWTPRYARMQTEDFIEKGYFQYQDKTYEIIVFDTLDKPPKIVM